MSYYQTLSKPELEAAFSAVKASYEAIKARGLKLDMSRGKPGADQMDISSTLFDLVGNQTGFLNETGIDCRNYGGLDGLPELKRLFSEILEVPQELIIVGGNSSLNLMFDVVAQAMTHGMPGGEKPWLLQKTKFLCPVPGYDRHFAICQHFGIEMICVPMMKDGPDMDMVERLVRDPAVKGMWCVPKYSNPDGITYSGQTVRRIAALKPAAGDFRVMWDNAYAVHDLTDRPDALENVYQAALAAGNPDLVILFTSTSKITFPGAGVAAAAASPANVAHLKNRMSFQTIGPDKLNQLRHARLFENLSKIRAHMRRHAQILRPKFQIVLEELDRQLRPLGIARWNEPKGGYFISLFVPDGCAKRTTALCAQAGLHLTPAGATYPYGVDLHDSNIRIAPTYPRLDELRQASELLCVCVQYAALEQALGIPAEGLHEI